MIIRLPIVVLGLVLLATTALAQAGHGDPVRGRQIAAARCGTCHGIGPSGSSAMPAAPAFRTLHDRYAVEGLGEALAEGIGVGNPAMPEHVLEDADITDLITYLKTLEAGEDPHVAAGRSLAERHCGGCHAVSGGASKLADAPPFRDLPARFALDRFTAAYEGGMFKGHPRMPQVEIDPDELEELAAYLRAVQAAAGA